MKSQNTVMRDPTLFRIVEHEHYRTKNRYTCWPNYDFVAPILDSIEGVTHAMRSKEYELRDELYFSILDDLELRKPKLISFSRLAIKGAPVSKRLITPLIEQQKVCGYDDIRLPTLMALRRRGIRPKAIKSFVLGFGLSKVESEPGWDKLLSENRKMIDEDTIRKFFVQHGSRVDIENIQTQEIEVKNHPTNANLGTRKVVASSPAYISPADANELCESEVFRLKDWCNLKVVQKSIVETQTPDGINEKMIILKCQKHNIENIQPKKKIQWVCDELKVAVKIDIAHDLFVDEKFNEKSLEQIYGWGERSLNLMQVGDVCQFERFGFVKLDCKKQDELQFVFISK
jgi:glutamyl-tRNA synthetase